MWWWAGGVSLGCWAHLSKLSHVTAQGFQWQHTAQHLFQGET